MIPDTLRHSAILLLGSHGEWAASKREGETNGKRTERAKEETRVQERSDEEDPLQGEEMACGVWCSEAPTHDRPFDGNLYDLGGTGQGDVP